MSNRMPLEVETVRAMSENGERTAVVARFDTAQIMDRYAPQEILHEIARAVAEKYVQENYTELVAKLNPEAIANLAIAEAGQRIAKAIHERPVVMQPEGPRTTNIKNSLF